MTKAFMSDDPKGFTWHIRSTNPRGGPLTPAEMGERALREAERILADVEAPRYYDDASLDALAFDALAADLAAVLPVLDELADDAHEDALAPLGWSSDLATIKEDCATVRMLRGMFARNRATLAAMEGR